MDGAAEVVAVRYRLVKNLRQVRPIRELCGYPDCLRTPPVI
jgi:hypothetical protein